MSCCGSKRQEWLEQAKASAHKKTEEEGPVFTPEKPGKVFEYTGPHSLFVHGPGSGKMYHFRYTGDKVEVDYIDSFALMAMRELKVLKL